MIELYGALWFIDALLLLVLVVVPGQWMLRAGAIFGAVAVNVGVLSAVPDTSGFAKDSALPQDAPVLSCWVREPEYVYFWLEQDGVPRAYRVNYTRDLHVLCEGASQANKQGVAVGIRKKKPKGQKNQGSGGRIKSPGKYEVYILPTIGAPKQ